MSAGPASVRVRVPGSTSNCGAGFDTLGLALQIYNVVSVGPAQADESGAVPELPSDRRAAGMAADAGRAFFAAVGRDFAAFRFAIAGEVPSARGLGSSVTVIAGVLAGLNAIHRGGLTAKDLVRIATDLEGHPDNASAGILGGFTVSRCDPANNAYRDTIRLEVPADLLFVVASPDTELVTKESRGALPEKLPYFDAVRSINSAAYLVAAFATRDYGRLRHAAGDFMHEPYRLPKIPGGKGAIEAGVAAGALTGWLSGSGSSVLCVCERAQAAAVGAAMQSAFNRVGINSTLRALAADNHGLRLE